MKDDLNLTIYCLFKTLKMEINQKTFDKRSLKYGRKENEEKQKNNGRHIFNRSLAVFFTLLFCSTSAYKHITKKQIYEKEM